ncbi:hypothetical protein JB92DRAFT_3145268 [Gautieria morchelliformis]|nr:hypothetical protein JB92DRAFT_3145268 [Gautieria morchelliformis]
MPALSSNICNVIANSPLPAAPQSSTAKSKSKKKKSTPGSEATAVQPPTKLVEWPPMSSAMSPLPKSIFFFYFGLKGMFSSKSKVQPHPNFAALENHEPDVMHDLELLNLSTTSKSSKSKKNKSSVAMAASMASKKRVSGIKRKKPVKDEVGPGLAAASPDPAPAIPPFSLNRPQTRKPPKAIAIRPE